jgi:hypothetical protein
VAGKSWYDSLSKPRFHRVWNEDTSWFHVMDIELTGTPSTKPLPLKDPALDLIFQQDKANGYRLTGIEGKPLQLPPSQTGYLLLCTGETTLHYSLDGNKDSRVMRAGHYLWVGAGQRLTIESTGATSNLVLLQMR